MGVGNRRGAGKGEGGGGQRKEEKEDKKRGDRNIIELIIFFKRLSIPHIVDSDTHIHVQYIFLILKLYRNVIVRDCGNSSDQGIECVHTDGACVSSPA